MTETLLMNMVYVVRGPRSVERPKTIDIDGNILGVPICMKQWCDFVAGPFRNTILARGWVERHIDVDDRIDIIYVTQTEEVKWENKI